MSAKSSSFFAYPGQPADLTATIDAAAKKAMQQSSRAAITIWPEMGVFGQIIPDKVRDSIRSARTLFFDITRPNQNVYYEAGFAIGLGKPVAPVLNSSFAGATTEIQKDGIFDNIGYKKYANSDDLAAILLEPPGAALLDLYAKELESQQPLFVLDTLFKTDFRNAIVSAVKSSRVHYRSFDPLETPRLSTVTMIAQITSSAGIILPMLPGHIEDAERHNLRAAFLAGLGHGLDRQTLLIQQRRFDEVNAADFREMITPVVDDKDIVSVVEGFSKAALLAGQSISQALAKPEKSALQRLSLGASAAENEFRTLSTYFVETAEFVRALRGEVNVVAGRKGSGKTAIFFQVRDNLREDRSNVVTDLKPESHQLSLFREELLQIVDAGAFDHTIAAFWYFLILSELVITMKWTFENRSRHDSRALEALTEIDEWLDKYQIGDSGDFTTRINRLSRFVVQEIEAAKKRRQAISAEFLTNVIFRGGVTSLKKLVLKYSDAYGQMILLFDNIDKGWPTKGVDEFDVRLVRLLVETLDKVRRDFSASSRDFMSIVFLRNDIYELLVGETPDRGKSGQVRIDWTDRAKLKQVIHKRLQASSGGTAQNFDQLWKKFFPTEIRGQDAFEFFVDHSLMRPRFLINILESAISNGINRGHVKVEEADCIDAVRQHSLYLIDDFGYEIRDVSGLTAELLYSLVGTEKTLTKEEFIRSFVKFGLGDAESKIAFDLMLWYGIIGITHKDGRDRFIYDYEYNLKRLEAEARLPGPDKRYVTNPALHVALSS